MKITNNNYTVIILTDNNKLKIQILSELKNNKEKINWNNYTLNSWFYTENGDPLTVKFICNVDRIIILQEGITR